MPESLSNSQSGQHARPRLGARPFGGAAAAAKANRPTAARRSVPRPFVQPGRDDPAVHDAPAAAVSLDRANTAAAQVLEAVAQQLRCGEIVLEQDDSDGGPVGVLASVLSALLGRRGDTWKEPAAPSENARTVL